MMTHSHTIKDFFYEVFQKMTDKSYLVEITANSIFFIFKVIACIVIYSVTIKFVKKLIPLFNKHTPANKVDTSLRSFFRSMINVGLHALLITICLLILGVKENSLFAFFGTLGIGVGLALKDNLSNFAGGIIILLFKTYYVGDEVRIANEMGYVHEIDIFFTSIRTHNGDIVMVPNGMIISNKLINYNKTPTRRLKFIIGVDYNCDLEVARKALEGILKKNPLVLDTPKPYTHVDSYSDSSINIALKGWTLNEDYWTVYKETLNEIKGALDKVGVSIPFPQMDVHLNTILKEESQNK
ncbi:mechanosensitive ion channel domain-containing protein [uncultured Fusobacterium sp.]|jgi:small conductance mechanosensitive channel|uniref:mechanosensitive ion channel family protein n=2 Tax=Fusobacterium TaxID=848 RepID=UPI002590EC85|nr:mechanosensitive ion channel domain-containing protein [uncultured Fusobacterium sp.]